MNRKVKYLSLLMIIVFCMSFLVMTTAVYADGSITVDCSSNQGTFPYYNQYVGTARCVTGPSDVQLMKDVGVKLERAFYDMCTVCYAENSYNWYALEDGGGYTPDNKYWGSDYLLDDIIAQGAQPYVDLLGIPVWLATNGQWDQPPTDWTKYETMVRDILTHLKNKYPQLVYVGLWNEPTNYSLYADGSMSAYETLYQHTANAVSAVNSALNPSQPLKIGGNNETSDESSLNTLLAWCRSNSVPIDFVSYHIYRYNPDDITSTVNTVQGYINNNGYTLDQLIGECGYPTEKGTTYSASSLAQSASYQVASWRNYTDTGLGEHVKPMTFTLNSYAHYNTSVIVPDFADSTDGQVFPLYNAYKMMSLMKSNLISSTSNNNGVYSIASSDSTGVAVLFTNYSSSAQNANINVNNLPSAFQSGNIHYERYLVDATHSNYAYNQSTQGLQKVEDSYLSSGSSKSFTINMGAYATSLIVLTPSAGTGDTTVDFEAYVQNQVISGTYAGIDWGNSTPEWKAYGPYGGLTSTVAFINSGSTSGVSKTITLPAGKVLKSVMIGSDTGDSGTVVISSSGNTDATYTLTPGSAGTLNTNWTTASQTVTITVTNSTGAWNVGFDNLVYGDAGSSSRDAFSQIEAESFDSQSGIQTESCSDTGGGLNIGYIDNGDYCIYNNVNFGSGASGFQARVASASSGGNIEIRLDSPTGTLVGTCSVSGTGGWQNWTTVNCNVSGASGTHNLYLKFTGGSSLFNVNWFKFTQSGSDTTVDFEAYTTNEQVISGTYAGIDWGNTTPNWVSYEPFGGLTSRVALIFSGGTSGVSKTITLPAGKVLKSVRIGCIGGSGTVVISSSSHSNATFTLTSDSAGTLNTNWTTASPTVTITVNNSTGAWNVGFDNLVYGD